jgi:hypothetical protein
MDSAAAVAAIAAERIADLEPFSLVQHRRAEHIAAVVASIGQVRNLAAAHHEIHLPLFL